MPTLVPSLTIRQNKFTSAAYGEQLLDRLAADLSSRFGRGFSPLNLGSMRAFYLAYVEETSQTLSKK